MSKIEIIRPDDKGFSKMMEFCAKSNKTLADELDKFLMKNADKWKIESDEEALIGAVCDRLRSYS